ncbi:MAG TPA: hypothetical protein VEC99_07205 [Clostridia bacterium]|nr:hypothetical protein [Clostridia bacterium]
MRIVLGGVDRAKPKACGFTLTEVAVSIALAALSFAGVIYGYVLTANQAEWSAYSLAAHSLALQGVEQARAAKWDPLAWPPIDELGVTNYLQTAQLDVPVTGGNPTWATNYVSITTILGNPPLRQLRADCVWSLPSRGTVVRGPFTNTVISLRAADQ